MARPEQIDDINLETLKRYRKGKWIDISASFQDYWFARQILKQKRDSVDGGTFLSYEVQVKAIESYRDSGLYADDSVATTDIFKRAYVPWHQSQASYTYDVNEQCFQGNDEVKIIDVLQGRIHAMWTDYYEKMEIRFWSAATSPSADPAQFYGIKTYLVASATAAFGFNGGDATGFTGAGVANLLRSTYPGLKNGTFTYQSISDDDALAKIVEANDKCYFMPPHDYSQLDGGEPDYGIYTVWSVKNRCERLVKAQNDNLGRELWKGRPMIKGTPIEWVPALSNQYLRDGATANPAYDSNDPILGINWKTTKVTFGKGCNMVVGSPIRRAGKHNVRDTFLDSAQQLELRDPRSCWYGNKAA
jgi:hypothetical protein